VCFATGGISSNLTQASAPTDLSISCQRSHYPRWCRLEGLEKQLSPHLQEGLRYRSDSLPPLGRPQEPSPISPLPQFTPSNRQTGLLCKLFRLLPSLSSRDGRRLRCPTGLRTFPHVSHCWASPAASCDVPYIVSNFMLQRCLCGCRRCAADIFFFCFSQAATATPRQEQLQNTPKPTSVSKRITTPHACAECKRRKIRCDGRQPCGQCLGCRSPKPCFYDKHRQRVIPSRKYGASTLSLVFR
jgi:hypothetical protein